LQQTTDDKDKSKPIGVEHWPYLIHRPSFPLASFLKHKPKKPAKNPIRTKKEITS